MLSYNMSRPLDFLEAYVFVYGSVDNMDPCLLAAAHLAACSARIAVSHARTHTHAQTLADSGKGNGSGKCKSLSRHQNKFTYYIQDLPKNQLLIVPKIGLIHVCVYTPEFSTVACFSVCSYST